MFGVFKAPCATADAKVQDFNTFSGAAKSGMWRHRQFQAHEELRERGELRALRASLKALDAVCRRAGVLAARAELATQGLEAELRHLVASGLSLRLEALEERFRRHAAAASRVEALEAELRQLAREPELRRLEGELHRVGSDLAPPPGVPRLRCRDGRGRRG